MQAFFFLNQIISNRILIVCNVSYVLFTIGALLKISPKNNTIPWCMAINLESIVLFQKFEPCDLTQALSLYQMSYLQISQAFVMYLVKLCWYIHATFGQMFILCGVTKVWLRALSFSRTIKSLQNDFSVKSWKLLYEQYESLKILTGLVNRAFGKMILVFQVLAILFYSRQVDVMIINISEGLSFFRLAIFFSSVILLYVLAADVCLKVV